MYLAIPHSCDWILARASLLDAIHQTFVAGLTETSNALREVEFVEGPVHAARHPTRQVLGLWNSDYLSGTGVESWGFVRLVGDYSLTDRTDISREVLERAFYVINQRLQGLKIDGAFIHRSWPNGSHTCLAGRGTEARQVSVGYSEARIGKGSPQSSAIVVVGPEFNLDRLKDVAAQATPLLSSLVTAASELIAPERQRRLATPDKLARLRTTLRAYTGADSDVLEGKIEVTAGAKGFSPEAKARNIGLSFDDWMKVDSPLSEAQRRILESDVITRHPLRIVGPAGSGKSLLMQLLALRTLARARELNVPCRLLYVVHNTAMAKATRERFDVLDPDGQLRSGSAELVVETLVDYALQEVGLSGSDVIDRNAETAKLFQLREIGDSLSAVLHGQQRFDETSVFRDALAKDALLAILSRLVSIEISLAIKGHGLEGERKKYVEVERPLTRFHGLLKPSDRKIVFDAFEGYHKKVFEGYGVLDSDDIALTLLGTLRTPLWELKRRTQGFDYVFVDEAQLFNENERRIFSLLANAAATHVPVVLALDQAQDIHGMVSAGLAALGIPNVANETLAVTHRSNHYIVDLAFFIIQRTTDLFGTEFPAFKKSAVRNAADRDQRSAHPTIEQAPTDDFGQFVVDRVRTLRKSNIRRICIVCFSDQYWSPVREALSNNSDLPLFELMERGGKLPQDKPVVVVTKPDFIGGQEFDAVLLVGLEQGLTPPRVVGNPALSAALEQQLLRELYLAVSRAKLRVSALLTRGAGVTQILRQAVQAGVLKEN